LYNDLCEILIVIIVVIFCYFY